MQRKIAKRSKTKRFCLLFPSFFKDLVFAKPFKLPGNPQPSPWNGSHTWPWALCCLGRAPGSDACGRSAQEAGGEGSERVLQVPEDDAL